VAEAEHNVVLVDGDMRRPSLDTYLDLTGSVGFSTVLTGRALLSEVLQKTRFPKLTVLTSGTVPPNPSELLGSLAAKKVMSETAFPLRPMSSWIRPRAGGYGCRDPSRRIRWCVGGSARFAGTKRDQLTHAVEISGKCWSPILGAVFTMTPAKEKGLTTTATTVM